MLEDGRGSRRAVEHRLDDTAVVICTDEVRSDPAPGSRRGPPRFRAMASRPALRVELVQHGVSASVAYFGFIDTEMVHRAIDADPIVDSMLAAYPRSLRKRLPPAAAAEAIASGIERRAPDLPPSKMGRDVDAAGHPESADDIRMERDATVQAAARELDSRQGGEQPITPTRAFR